MFRRILGWLGLGGKPKTIEAAHSAPDSGQSPHPGPATAFPGAQSQAPTASSPPGPAPDFDATASPNPPAERGLPREIELIAGIDFGTSCTKVVVRLPYESGEPTYPLPVPPDRRAESHPHLWLSELWVTADGRFSLFPTEPATRLKDLKWSLMQGPELYSEPRPEPSAIEAAGAFLALHMQRTRAWFARRRSDLATDGFELRWSWHVGFPAASLDDYARRLRYEICLAAALELASGSLPLTLSAVREAVSRVRDTAATKIREAGAAIFPEIAAAVAGFAHSPRHEDGLYAMIDVGAATSDCCSFNLARRSGAYICPIFMADVARLGVEPYRTCSGDPVKESEFRCQLRVQARTVIWRTRHCRCHSSPRWEHGLPLFLIGGGAASEPHRANAESLTPWIRYHFRAHNYPNPGIPITALPVPELLDYEGEPPSAHRLAVAVGLSLPFDQIPDVELPGTIPDEKPPPLIDITGVYIDPSQM